jgi:hypothetical protein
MVDVDQLRTTQRASNAQHVLGDWTDKPDIAASTVDVENESGDTMWVEIAGGTVTAVKVDGVTIGARTSGAFLVRAGSVISITYSAAPTWQWFRVVV